MCSTRSFPRSKSKLPHKQVYKKQYFPPFQPKVTSADDVRYFDREFLEQKIDRSEVCSMKLYLYFNSEHNIQRGPEATPIRNAALPN